MVESERVAESLSADELQQRICSWMEEALEQDGDPATCTWNVLERVKAEGLGDALLDTYGPRLIDELWREHDGPEDNNHVDQKVIAENKPGTRRVDVAQLSSKTALLETLHHLNGNWYRLGDLNRLQCVACRVAHLRCSAVVLLRPMRRARGPSCSAV